MENTKSALTADQENLTAQLEDALSLNEKNFKLASQLEQQNRELELERGVLQRSMVGFSVEMDAAKERLEEALKKANVQLSSRT